MAVINGARIRERRDELGIKPAQLAKRLGISAGYLRNIENGNAQVRVGHVAHLLAEALWLPIGELSAESEEKETERKEEPTRPTRRQENEQTTGPKRASDKAVA